MPWTAPTDLTTGTLITASIYNAQIIDNLKYLHGDAGVIGLVNDVSNGPTSASPGGGGVAGVYLGQPGYLVSVAAAAGTTGLALSITTDSQHRLTSDHNGRFQWGPGGSTAPDSAFGRLAAGVLGDTATSLSSGPVSGSLNGAQTAGVLLNSSGATQAFSSTSTGFILTGAVTTDNGGNYRISIDASGKMSWASGSGGATDTTLARSVGSVLKVSNALRQVKATIAYAASMTPDASAGVWQSITVTNGTAFTINNPTNPPTSSETQDLTIEIFNNSGGAMGAVTWGSAYRFVSLAPGNGQKVAFHYRWSGTAWVCIAATGPYA